MDLQTFFYQLLLSQEENSIVGFKDRDMAREKELFFSGLLLEVYWSWPINLFCSRLLFQYDMKQLLTHWKTWNNPACLCLFWSLLLLRNSLQAIQERPWSKFIKGAFYSHIVHRNPGECQDGLWQCKMRCSYSYLLSCFNDHIFQVEKWHGCGGKWNKYETYGDKYWLLQ